MEVEYMKKVIVCIVVILLFAGNVWGGGKKETSGQDSVVWKFSCHDAADTIYTKAFRAMWDRVERETNGAIKVEMYDLGRVHTT